MAVQPNIRPADAYEIALSLLTRPQTSRKDILKEAARLVVGDGARVAILLWLYDPEWKALLLSRFWSSHTDTIPKELVGSIIFWRHEPTDGCDSDPLKWGLSLDALPEIRAWASLFGFAKSDRAMAITKLTAEKAEPVGFVQVFSSRTLPEAIEAALTPYAEALAVLIDRGRNDRLVKALIDVQGHSEPKTSLKEWLETAASVLREVTKAEACLIFREVHGIIDVAAYATTAGRADKLQLRVAQSSVIRRVARMQKITRIRMFSDLEERERILGTRENDADLQAMVEKIILQKQIRAVLLAPVIFEGHTIAVIVLLNKMIEHHIAAAFTLTDQKILATLCEYLAGVLPSFEMYQALNRMSEISASHVHALDESAEREKTYNLLVGMIPGVTGAALIRRKRGDEKPRLYPLGGKIWSEDVEELTRHSGKVTLVPGGLADENYLTTKIESLELAEPAWLVLQLARGFLNAYEREYILAFFRIQLSHVLVADQGADELIDHFAQLRHAVRSGLTGVNGYIEEATEAFNEYRETGDTDVLEEAKLHKALYRARQSAKKTDYLLDVSRFLLGNITRSSLRVGRHSVNAVVLSVLDTLRPAAEDRNLVLNIHEKLPETMDEAIFDRPLIEMLTFNLVENAIKYSHRNKRVDVAVRIGQGGYWILRVSDIGIWIRPEDKERIWEPFTRRPTGQHAESRPGTGLGLAVCRQIAQAHEGKITYRSEMKDAEAAVTSFSLQIPRGVK